MGTDRYAYQSRLRRVSPMPKLLLTVVTLVVCLCSFTDLPMAVIFLLAQLSEVIKAVIGFWMLKSGIWAKNLIHDLGGKAEESTL